MCRADRKVTKLHFGWKEKRLLFQLLLSGLRHFCCANFLFRIFRSDTPLAHAHCAAKQPRRPSKIAKCIFLQEGDKNTFHLYGRKLLFYAIAISLLNFYLSIRFFPGQNLRSLRAQRGLELWLERRKRSGCQSWRILCRLETTWVASLYWR